MMKVIATIIDMIDFTQLPAPLGEDGELHIRVTELLPTGHLPVKLPDYNNRLRVLVATYVTFSPNGTELLVNMGGEQVCLAARGSSALLHPTVSSQGLTPHFQCHEADRQQPYCKLLHSEM